MNEPKRDEIDHFAIHAEMMMFKQRLDDFVTESREDRKETRRLIEMQSDESRKTFREVSDQFSQGERMFGQVMSRIDALTDKVANAKEERAALKADVSALKTESNVRKGERGAWAAIINSKPLAWLVAAATALWAFLTQTGGPK